MQSIRQLHEAALKERQKAEDLRKAGTRDLLRAQDAMSDPLASQQYSNNAQKYDEKAALRDLEATKFDAEAATLELRILELNRQKNEIQSASLANISRLESEEKSLRG